MSSQPVLSFQQFVHQHEKYDLWSLYLYPEYELFQPISSLNWVYYMDLDIVWFGDQKSPSQGSEIYSIQQA